MKLKLVHWVILFLTAFNVFVWAPALLPRDDKQELTIHVLDVGQGDAILIETPDGKFGLIDTGRGRQVLGSMAEVMPWLEYELEFVLLTHPDADHIGGFLAVAERYDIQQVFWLKSDKDSAVWEAVQQEVVEQGIPSFVLDDTHTFLLGCCTLVDTVWPLAEADTFRETELNDASISVVLKYKQFEMFLGGDLSSEYELAALQPYLGNLAKFEVLKVGHHGSKTSSSEELLGSMQPTISAISVGADNPYGHPAPQVTDILHRYSPWVVATADEGTISVSTDGLLNMQLKTANRLENLGIKN